MQTFLPLPDFRKSLQSLDNKRLGKQRVEGMQLINAICGESKGWRNHPAAVMWRLNTDALRLYTNIAIEEWVKRGFKNTMQTYDVPKRLRMPWWLGDERLHSSHRSNLIRKDSAFYRKQGWKEPDDMPYWWPPLRVYVVGEHLRFDDGRKHNKPTRTACHAKLEAGVARVDARLSDLKPACKLCSRRLAALVAAGRNLEGGLL